MKSYNYEKIYLAARGDAKLIVNLFLYENVPGPNWVNNPEGIACLRDSHPVGEIAEYIGICALRPFGQLDLTKDDIPPWVPWKVVKENTLIQVDGSLINFYLDKKEK